MPQVGHIEEGPDTLRILITTDNHVGYNENDPVRGDDAWKTFEEIMYIARDNDVDMVLQCGDLFHVNKPTKKSFYHVMKTLRHTCFGDRPCELELLSDPSLVFDDGFNSVNYEDPNLNISIPVFSISGNHDDASGQGLLSPLDLLSVGGLINHFGRVTQSDDITITPLLLQKGLTKLSLFGMASVRDERLFKTFRDGKVKFNFPSVQEDEWFNLMCVHQNHTAHTNTGYLPETFLPNALDLVIWGHEHECIPYTVPNPATGFETLQPGSSVATSLCEGEAVEKKVFILTINQRNYNLTPIKLKTVRPFHMLEIALSTVPGLRTGLAYKTQVTQFLIEKVEKLIKDANEDYKAENPDDESPPLPLIRLRVDYSGGYEVENPRRFSNRFVGKVANVNSVVQFHKKDRTLNRSSKNGKISIGETGEDSGANGKKKDNEESEVDVESLINQYLKSFNLALLPEEGLNEAVKQFVHKEDKTAVKEFVDLEMESEVKQLMANEGLNFNDDFKAILKNIKKERGATPEVRSLPSVEAREASVPSTTKKTSSSKSSSSKSSKSKSKKKSEDFVVDSDEDMDLDEIPQSPEVAHSSRKSKRAASSKPKSYQVNSDDDVQDNNDSNDDNFTDDDVQVIDSQSDHDLDQDDEIQVTKTPSPPSKPSRGRGSRGSRGTRGGSTRGTASRGGRGGRGGSKASQSASSLRGRDADTPVTDIISGLLSRKRK